jgi:hypothetical protein
VNLIPIPTSPKIYHILHVDRLASVLAEDQLWSDAEIQRRKLPGTSIGLSRIKQRRLSTNFLASHPSLSVGSCVPFYFCPRSIMLYLIWQGNYADLDYRGGQEPIVHLEYDLRSAVEWADQNNRRWAFTLSNAGSTFFEDRADLSQLHELHWAAIASRVWSGSGVDSAIKEGKQAEFLLETSVPWPLVERVGVFSQAIYQRVVMLLSQTATHRPAVEILKDWYY